MADGLNIPRIKELRSFFMDLADDDERFDMGDWIVSNPNAECGTTACVAGWACVKFNPELGPKSYLTTSHYEEVASKLLGITEYSISETLFYGPACATPHMAALALDQVLEGATEVDWDNAWQLAGFRCRDVIAGNGCEDHGVRQCSQCGDYAEFQLLDSDVVCAGCLIGDGNCHLCYEPIQYCQGHADKTCACICDEGCLCGDCGFDEVQHNMEVQNAQRI